jgi:hypothetical protein
MQYRSPEWKAKVLDPQTAMRWADKLERDDGEETADWFRRDFNEKAVFGEEHGEYRYWATGVHEPVIPTEE